jgi:hypothetical protein
MRSAARKIRPAWEVGGCCVARIALAQSGAAFPDFARAHPGYERLPCVGAGLKPAPTCVGRGAEAVFIGRSRRCEKCRDYALCTRAGLDDIAAYLHALDAQ